MYLIVEFVTSENLKKSITLSLYIHTQANYANKMKIDTIQKKKKPKRTSKVSKKYICIKKFTSKNYYSLVLAHVYWSCDTNIDN